jgi:Peptidase family C25
MHATVALILALIVTPCIVGVVGGNAAAKPDLSFLARAFVSTPLLSPAPLPLVVNSTTDVGDLTPGDGVCLTATAVCTLRAAIEESNAVNDVDTINFLIPGVGVQTISPASALPAITQPVTIDGYTQTGASQNTLAVGDNAVINIELNGTGAGALVDGLRISAGSCTVRGLAIYKFAGDGIELLTAGGNTIEGNFIGTDATGAGTTNGNARDGVNITNVGTNSIGGSTPQARNIISANSIEGLEISGASATGNTIRGNYIGTDRNGTADVGNLNNGVFISGPSNTIGGSTVTPGQGAGNLISGNTLAGIRITGANTNTVAGNLIGLQSNGTTARANDLEGVFITNGASSNTIGGITSDLRNVISGNSTVSGTDGIEINGTGTNSNVVLGNYIGTNVAGTGAVPNNDGVKVANGAQSNTIGGLTSTPGTASGNVISGNNSDGIEFLGTATIITSSNNVQGNLIGLQAGGLALLRNTSNGVLIDNSSSNTIGGSTTTARNIITGGTSVNSDGVDIQDNPSDNNVIAGNYIGTDISGTLDFGAGGDGVRLSGTGPDTNTIGGSTTAPGTAPGNVISGNNGDGVEITASGTTGNLVQGNLIGTQANGTSALANGTNGVLISSLAATNTIGGSTTTPGTGLGNVISGNGTNGVQISTDANTNTVRGNLIGLQAGGTAALGNATNGVHLTGVITCTIGGATSDLRNIISANGSNGVLLNEGQVSVSDNNTVAGNYIGTDITGSVDLGNTGDGVNVNGGDVSTIGGLATTTGAAPGNVISGNNSDGVDLVDSGGDTNTITIRGNFIGLKANGTEALPNTGDGVGIRTGVTVTTVGGTTATARNVISGNGSDGIEFASGGHTIQGNYIGTQSNGTSGLGNSGHGIFDSAATTTATTIGGTASGAPNTIAFNVGDGVYISSGINISIRANSIFSNLGLGIDLGSDGVTPNDNQDPDTGANNLQNFPIITSANSNTQVITGRLNSTPGQAFTIDFYKNPSCDGTNGEGKTYLGSVLTGTTDANGDVTFNFTATAPTFAATEVITATATDSAGNTSEFSACAIATLVRLRQFTASYYADGVELNWDSGFEVNNLGYHVYREVNGHRTRVTPSIIAGSALTVGPGIRLGAGYSYSWFDSAGSADAVYSLEAIDLSGASEWAGPVVPYAHPGKPKAGRPFERDRARLLSEINASEQDSVISYWPAQTSSFSAAQTPNFLKSGKDAVAQPLDVQQAIAADKAIKIQIKKSGWYRLTQPELVAAGFDPSSDPRSLQLFADGEEVAISLSAEGSQFGNNDTIEFFGVPLDTPTTDSRIYWLVAGNSPGKRIVARRTKTKVSDQSSEPLPGGFDMTVERKERLVYFSGLLNGDAENIFGAPVRTEPLNQTLPLVNLDPASISQPVVEVALQGLTAADHKVQLKVNGTSVGVVTFNERDHVVAKFNVDPAMLQEGDNVVAVASLNGSSDISLLDWVRLTYPHRYKADNDALTLTVPSSQPLRIDGFSSPNVRVVDVTDPNSPAQLSALANKSGTTYSIKVQTTGNGPRTLIALTENLMAHPASLMSNAVSTWNAASNTADLVIITHKDFKPAVEPLANLRRSQGMLVSVVDVEDIYDEFAFGAHTPIALKSFVLATANWSRRPGYLLLVGDSSWDPRDYLNKGSNDFVPMKLIDTQAMETGSDEWIGDFAGAGLANISVGRLPARTPADTSLMVSKILSYEQERELNAPLRGAVMVADTGFEPQSGAARALLPSNLTVETINRAELASDDLARGRIIEALNQGPTLVNYYGHGSVKVWTSSGLLSSDLAATLTNTNRLSVFVMMTCLNGYANDANVDSLAESVLKSPNGGAVAVWASTGFTTPQPQFEINSEFYRLLFGSQPMRLGDAARGAKAATTDMDVRRTWTLLGDPAMRVR